jgi:hypothetical protein
LPTVEPILAQTDRLEQILAALVAAHESLLALTHEHRAAISRADGAAAQNCAKRQAELAGQIATLESGRRTHLAQMLPAANPAAPLATFTSHLPEPARGRITRIAARLRELLLQIQEQMRVIRSATSAIIAHMDGLMQQVAKALSQAGLYGPRGRLDQAPPAPCGLDLTL